MQHRWTSRSLIATLAAFTFMAACGDGGTDPSTPELNDFITAVSASSGNLSAQYHAGSAPTGGSGPAISATGSSALILGGSTLRTISGSAGFNRIIVAVEGVPGYWELSLASNVTTQDVILSVAQDIPNTSFTLQYAGGTSAGIGAVDEEAVSVIEVGTGDIQVSVSWDTESDVDLHLIEPNGAEIYYGDSESASGGTLDLDSNAGCAIDGKKNENITWPNGTPPRGTYTVRVDYWASCGVAKTNYVVTVRVAGRAAQTFTGSFTGEGTNGGAGDGVTITTFTF